MRITCVVFKPRILERAGDSACLTRATDDFLPLRSERFCPNSALGLKAQRGHDLPSVTGHLKASHHVAPRFTRSLHLAASHSAYSHHLSFRRAGCCFANK